jgi:RHS repeat-associated protein
VARRGFAGLRRAFRRISRPVRSVLAVALGPVLTAGGMALPSGAMVAAGAAGVTAVVAASVATAPATRAATVTGPVLVLLQNGEVTAPETTVLRSAGWTVTQATPSAWESMTAAQFETYAVLVIGDPSAAGSCSSLTPLAAASGTDAIGTAWQSAVSGNVAVLGTAPAAAGTTAAGNLVAAAVSYAAAKYASGAGTGVYVSLNCEYKAASGETAVPLLNGVEGIGAAGGLTVRGGLSCTDPGTVNRWEAAAAGTFGPVASDSLGVGSWASPGCPVQEAFNSWPAMFTPAAYDAASDATADFTASDGGSGQPYVLLGQPVSAATAALAPGTGGEVPAASAVGGSNPAAPGVKQATAADLVDTESGDFTQSATDLSVPGFGPALDFGRTYDAAAARRETMAGAPGPMGYGWTDNWATSLTAGRPVTGDIYTVSTPGVSAYEPVDTASDGAGDVFYADATANDVVEVAAAGHTQFGISMTAGNAYVVAGSAAGTAGHSGDGGAAASALLNEPWGLTLDGSGDLFIADLGNNRVQEVPAASGTHFGISMTADDMYTVAGSSSGTAGSSGDGGAASSSLLDYPVSVQADRAGDLYISDEQNFRVQEVAAASGTQHGVSMTAGDVYTVAGETGTSNFSGDGGPATSAAMVSPAGLALDAAGDLYIADDYADVIREVPAAAGTQWGQPMTAGDIYTVAGNPAVAGTGGSSGDGGPAASAELDNPIGVTADAAGDLYIADTLNNRLQEVPAASGTQWGQSMTAGDMYTVINSSMTAGDAGDGGPAAAAGLNLPGPVTFGPSGDMFIPDALDSKIREVFTAAAQLFPASPAGTGITVSQANGAQVTFYPQSGGSCTAPYVTAGGSGYCTLPQDTSAGLTYSPSAGTYTYTPSPGTSYTYSASTGTLESEADTAGDTLTLTTGSPSPGSGNCPPTASTCTTITAASGRSLVLGYNSAGLVTSATDPLRRRWTYAYNAASQLTSATDPMSHVTSYTYGAGSTGNPQLSSDLLTITSPNAQPGGPDAGDSTSNVYNSTGQVTSQTDPLGVVTTFNYCVSAAAGNCLNSSTGTGDVTVSGSDGTTRVDSYTQGVLAAETTWNGSTPSERDYGPALTAAGGGGTLLDVWSTDTGGSLTSYTYDTAGRLASLTDPLSDTTTMASTALGETSCSADAEAASPCSSSQSGPAPVSPGGVITPPSSAPPPGVSYTLYDTDGRALYNSVGIYPPGSDTASSTQTAYTLYAGNSVTVSGTNVTCAATPPAPSLPCAEVDSRGNATQLTYSSAGDLTSESTPDGNGSELATVTYAYDADGERTSVVSADGNLPGANAGNYTTVTAYNADGEQTAITQAGGPGATVTSRTTAYGYDANGNQTTVTDPRGYATVTTYNADDEKMTVTDPDGNAHLTCYDEHGNVAQTVPPAGVAANHLTAASCPTSYPSGYTDRLASDATTHTFNNLGQETSSTTPAPAGQSGYETVTITYNAAGLPVEEDGPPVTSGGPQQVTVNSYNADGQLTSTTTGYGTSAASTVSSCYDPDGNQTAAIAADGNVNGVAPCETSSPWTVSPSSYPTQAAYQTTKSYNSVGQLVSTTSPATAAAPNGATTTFTYDAYGDLVTSTDPNGVTTTVGYATPGGQVASLAYSGSAAHSVSYTYDAQGTRTGMTDATGTSSYSHDPFGELTSVTNGAGQTVSYAYDADGNTTGITYPLPASATWATSQTVGYGYDHAGRLTSATDFTGHQIAITPSPDGQPSAEALGSTGDTISYTYDAAGGASAIALANSSSTLQSFTYSDAPDGEILSEADVPSSPVSPASYAYDPQGRLASATSGSEATLAYSFDASGNLTTLPTGATGTYDYAGELTSATASGTTTTYAYNADGERLTTAQDSATIASATWNGAGQVTSYSGPSADMTSATYDGDGLRASAATGSGTEDFVWDGRSRLLMDSGNAYIYAGGNTPAEQVSLSDGTTSYLVADALGSVRGIVNSSGTLAATTSYDPWGNPVTTSGLTDSTPFGYAGGYTDPTGLIYLVNRYYDPGTGQFLSEDPAVSQTGQPYAYAGGNPVNATDPTGLWELALPSNQNPNSSEAAFETEYVGPILGLGITASSQFAFDMPHPYPNRRVDLYFSDSKNFGWLNELKVGRQLSSNAATISEVLRDRVMLEEPHNVCHPVDNIFGHTPCDRMPINGDTWWFRYQTGATCQMSWLATAEGNWCPDTRLRSDLLQGKPQINIVYVYYMNQDDFQTIINRVYGSSKEKAVIRNAVESNTCPSRAIATLGEEFPSIKYCL